MNRVKSFWTRYFTWETQVTNNTSITTVELVLNDYVNPARTLGYFIAIIYIYICIIILTCYWLIGFSKNC